MSDLKTPATNAAPASQFVDLYQDGEIVLLNKSVGPMIDYHNRVLDLRRLTRDQAHQLAMDPKFRSVAYKEVADAILQKRAKDKAEAIEAAKKKL